MTTLAPDTSTWNVVLRRVSDPAELKALGASSITVVAVSLLLAAGGLALALGGVSWSGWVLAVIGLLAAGIWGIVIANNRAAAKLTGDDLIEIIVADEGVIGQGGLALGWDEISEIQFEWTKTVFTGGATAQVGASVAGAVFDAAGIDTTLKAFQVRLKDYKSVKARTTSKIQRLALFGPMLGDPGYLHVGQNGHSPEAMKELIDVLTAQGARHGVALTRKAS